MFKVFDLNKKVEITKDKYTVNKYGQLIVPEKELIKEKIKFTLVEPADFDYIDVFKYENYYIIHDYNTHHDKEGAWYIISNIDKLIEKKKNEYSFICYKNYMKEL